MTEQERRMVKQCRGKTAFSDLVGIIDRLDKQSIAMLSLLENCLIVLPPSRTELRQAITVLLKEAKEQ